MKFSIKTDSLKKSLSAVQSLITENQILLTANDDTGYIIIEAGNNGIYLKQRIKAEVESGGFTVLNSTYLSSLKLGERVDLQKNGNALAFKSGKLSGRIETHQSHQKIADQRPQEDIEAQTLVLREIITKGVKKSNFSAIIASAQEGLRVKLDTDLTISNTDSYRLSLFKSKLPAPSKPIDFLIKPDILASVLSKMDEPEVWLGLKKGIIRIASPSFEFYHPVLQIEPTDVEGWVNDLDPKDKICEIQTKTQDLLGLITGVGSIAKGGSGEEVDLKCSLVNNIFSVEVGAIHGSAKGDIVVEQSSADKHHFTLSYKHTTEMLSLINDGDIKIAFYDPYIILTSWDGTCLNLIPTKTI
jgi:DNA polymerase III sliding clamp (beta) subunit (PCNA family)